MSDGGISVTGLMVSNGVVGTIGGLIGAWIKARHGRTRVEPQPLDVRDATNRSLEAHMDDNRRDHSNIFSRISHTEQRVSALEASAQAQGRQLDRIDSKLDRVLEKLR